MKIAHLHAGSEIYGPGSRFVIWTQGCSLHCPGCWNKDFWSFNRGSTITTDDLLSQIQNASASIEGVTVLGGEPFDQALELLEFAMRLRNTGLSLMVYSGYRYEELLAAGHANLLQYCDLLIEGRYEHRLRNTSLRWRGSSNQRVMFLSSRYNGHPLEEASEIEIVLDAMGAIQAYGYPEAWVFGEEKR